MKVFASCALENSFFLPRSQLALSCHVPVAARRCWLQDAMRMSRRHRARGTAAAAATDGPAAAPAGRTRGAAPTPAPISPSADVPDWVGPPGSSVADTRDSPALISNRELEASLCRAKCGRCDEPDCPGARDPAGKGHGCTEFSRSRGDLAWLRGDHADARQPSAAQLAVLRRPAVSLVVTGEIGKISGENLLCYYRAAATGLKRLGCISSRSVEGAVPALRKSLAAYFSSGFSDAAMVGAGDDAVAIDEYLERDGRTRKDLAAEAAGGGSAVAGEGCSRRE